MACAEEIGSSLSTSAISGAIFMSNRSTMKEFIRLKLFGLPSSYQRLVMEIRSGMVLFLFEYEERKLYGVFEATCDGALNIMPHAFTSSVKLFPAQIRFMRLWHCDPLTEREFYPAIKDNYYSHQKFHFDLSEKQVFMLLHLFDLKKKGYHKKPSSDMYAKASVPYWTPSSAKLKLKAYQGFGSFRKKHRNNDHVKSFLYQDSGKHDPDYLTSSNRSFLGRDASPTGMKSQSHSKTYGSHVFKEKQFVFSESPWNFMSIGKDPVSPLRGLHQGNLSSPNFLPTSDSSSRNACIEGCNQYNSISSVFQHEQPSKAFSRNACIEGSQNHSCRQHLDSVNLLSSEYLPINVSSAETYLCQPRLDQENLSSSNFLTRSVSSSSAEAYLGIRSLQDYNTSYLSSFDYESSRGRTEVDDVGYLYSQSIYEPHGLSTFRTLRNTQNREGLKADALFLGESNDPLYPQNYSQMCKLEDSIQVPRYWKSGHSYTYIPDTEISDKVMVSAKTEPLNDLDSLKWKSMYNEDEVSMHYPWHDSKTLAADVNYGTGINSDTHRMKTSVFSRLSDGRIAQQQQQQEYVRMMDDDPSVDQIMSRLARLRNKCKKSRLFLCQTTAGPKQSSENVKIVQNRASDFSYEDECHDYIGMHSEKRITKFLNFKRRSEACKIGDESIVCSLVNQKRLARPSISQVPHGNGNSKHEDGKIRDCQILGVACPSNKASSETDIASDHANTIEIDECKGIAGTVRRSKLSRLSFSQVSLENGNNKQLDGKIKVFHILGDECLSNKASSETDIASYHENINEIDECKGIAGTIKRRKLTRPSFSQVSLGNEYNRHQDGKIRDCHILEDAYPSRRASSETDTALAPENINENNECKKIAGTGRMPANQNKRRKLTRPSFSQVALGDENSKHQAGKIRDCQIFGDACLSSKASSEKDIALDHENINQIDECKEIAGTDRTPTHQIKRRKLIRPIFSDVSHGNGNSEHQDGKIRNCQILGDPNPYNKASSEKNIASDHENVNDIDECKGIVRTDRTPAHLGSLESEICNNHNPELSSKMSVRKTEEMSKKFEAQSGELGKACPYTKTSSEKGLTSDHENFNEIDECKGITETGRTPAHLGTHESEICNNHKPELSKECEAQAEELGDACPYDKTSFEKGIASDRENINEIDDCKGIVGTGMRPSHLETHESEVCNNHNPEFSSKASVRKIKELSKGCEAQVGELFVDSLGVPFSFTERKFKCQTPQSSFGLYLESYGLSEKAEDKGIRCTKKSNKLEVDCTGSSKKILYQDEETPLIYRERNHKGTVFYSSVIDVHAAAETTLSRDENQSHVNMKPLLSLIGVDLQNCSDNRVSGRDAFFPGANTEVIDIQTKYDINEDVPVDLDNHRIQRSVGNLNNMKGDLYGTAASREDKDLSTIMKPSLPYFNYNQVNGKSTAMPEAYNGEIDFQNREKSIDGVPERLDNFLTLRPGRSAEDSGDKVLHVETDIITSVLSAFKNSVDNTANDVSGSTNISPVYKRKIAKVNDKTSVEWCHPECRYEDILAASCSQKEIKQEDVHDSGNRVPHGNEENNSLFDVHKGNYLDSSKCGIELSVEDDYLARSSWEHATENMRAASPLNH